MIMGFGQIIYINIVIVRNLFRGCFRCQYQKRVMFNFVNVTNSNGNRHREGKCVIHEARLG